jgi:hypothetical protein
MKKKSAKSSKMLSQSSDVLMLGGLYLLTFLVLQMVNFISATAKYGDFIDVTELKTKCVAQFLAFLSAYFITLIYIKNRSR